MANNFEIIPDQQTPKVTETISIEKNREVFLEFFEFAKQQHNAVGLAANQCNLNGKRFNQRIFAIKHLKEDTWRLIIDPVVSEYVGMKEMKLEGCLTWCDKMILAKRSRAVIVKYYDIDGNLYENELHYGFDAQIWQHEINHLDGIPETVVEPNYKLPLELKIGRNEPCPCGSGKKYKQCCLKYESIY